MGFIQKFVERVRGKEVELRRTTIEEFKTRDLALQHEYKVLGSQPELRSSLENPQTPLSYPAEWLLDIFNGGRTDSGIRVSELTALQVDSVLACVKIICNATATLPLHVFEHQVKDNRNAKRKAFDNPVYDLLRSNPNPEMTSHVWRVVMMCHALLWGNSYSEIQRDGAARPIAF